MDAPAEDTDFTSIFDGSGRSQPEVPPRRRRDGDDLPVAGLEQGWVGDPAEIRDIARAGAEDYTIRILQPDDDPGAIEKRTTE